MSSVGVRIAEARKRLGITQPVLAEKLGVTPGAVGQWEAGHFKPGRDRLHSIATVLGVTTDWLLCRTDDPKGRIITGVGGIQSLESFGTPKVIQVDASRLSDADLAQEVSERLKRKKRPARDPLAIGNAKVVQMPKSHKVPVQLGVADHQKGSVVTPDAVEVDVRFARTDHYCLKIYGRSMEPRLYEGDTVVVKKMDLYLPPYIEDERPPAPPGPWKALHSKIVVALVNEDDAYLVKRLRVSSRKDTGFKLWLVGDNPASEPVEISKEHSLRLVGRVVQIMSDPDRT